MTSTLSQKILELRKDLADLLKVDPLDINRLLQLSSQLARLDPEHVRFASDAALIDRLGQELVARQETAVSELVKNAYDADATELVATFENAQAANGSLTLTDDGSGMTRDELVDGFMRLASTGKIATPVSPKFRRARAGRKGIGRFSAQRLGRELIVTTQTAESSEALRLRIDWNRFAPGTDLGCIATRVETVAKERLHGTTLQITGLRERWKTDQISRVFRYVEELLDPFPRLSKPERSVSTSGSVIDPGFKAIFYSKAEQREAELVASEDRMVLDYALAVVDAEVDENGNAWTQIQSSILEIDEKTALRLDDRENESIFSTLRNVALKAYYFIYDPSLMPAHARARLQRLGTEQGGFRLYRNGFRVLPYGERRNDWLGLDEESRRRAILPPIANPNWFGVITVTDQKNDMFFEVSSREGLEQNLAMQELTQFGHAVAIKSAVRIASARGRKETAGRSNTKLRPVTSITPGILREDAKKLLASNSTARQPSLIDPPSNTIAEAAESVASHLQSAADLLQEQTTELEMLRVLSSLGLLVATFTHEARNRVMSIRDQLYLLQTDPTLPTEAVEQIVTVRKATDDLKSYLGYFDSTLTEVLHREIEPQDVSALLYDFIKAFRPIAVRWGVSIESSVEEGLLSVPMVSSEWSSILTNLFTNSVKAISRAKEPTGLIHITAVRDGQHVVVDFLDNGDGIDEAHRSQIFDAFFTLATATEDHDLGGMGLGLKIVKDIINSRNGTVEVIDPPVGFSTCIRVKLGAN